MAAENQHCCAVGGVAELKIVEEVLDEFEHLCSRLGGVSAEDKLQFSLAVSEILTNMITHSQPSIGSHQMIINAELCVHPHCLQATLRDDAQPAQVMLSDLSLPDDLLTESGRGLAISTMVLDRLEHRTDDGNVWTLERTRRH